MSDITTMGIAVNSTQVVSASRDLNRLSTAARTADGSVDGLGDQAQATGTQLQSATASANVLKAAVVALASSVAVAFVGSTVVKFETAMLGLKATANATAKEMALFEKQSRSLGATSVFSATQVGQAQKFLAQAGFDTSEILKSTSATLKLASAGSLELAAAADIASNVVGGMNLKVADLGRVVDTLAQAARSSNTDVTQLASALSRAAPLAAASGVSLAEVSSIIGVLSDNSIQGERAGTAFGGMIRQLSNATPKTEKALAKYGITMSEVNIQTNGLSNVLNTLGKVNISAGDAISIFGAEAAAAGLILGKNAQRFDELTDTINNAEGAASEMSDTISSGLSGSLTSLGSAVEEAALQLGDSGLAGAFDSAIDGTTALISAYTGMLPALAEANGLTSEYVANVNFIKDAIDAAAIGVGVFAGALAAKIVVIKALTIATAAATGGFAALNLVLLANPFTALAVAIGATAVAVGLYVGVTQDATEATKELTGVIEDNSIAYDNQGNAIASLSKEQTSAILLSTRATLADAKANALASQQIIDGYTRQINATKSVLEARLLLSKHDSTLRTAQIKGNVDLENAISQLALEQSLQIDLQQMHNNVIAAAEEDVKALQKSLDALNKTNKNGTGQTNESSKAQKALNKIMSEGRKVFTDTRTPVENYSIELAKLGELLNANAVSADTYARAIVAATSDLEDATGITKENEDALKSIEDQQQKTFDSWSENLTSIISGSKSVGDVLDDLAAKLLQDVFINPLLISVGIGGTAQSPSQFSGLIPGQGNGGSGASRILGSMGGSNYAGHAASFAKSSIGQSLGYSAVETLPEGFIGPANLGLTSSGSSLAEAGGFMDGLSTTGVVSAITGAIEGFENKGIVGGVSGAAGGYFGAEAGATLGASIAGPVGAAVGAVLGGLLGSTVGANLFGTDYSSIGTGVETGISGLGVNENSTLLNFEEKKKSFFRGTKSKQTPIDGFDDISIAVEEALSGVSNTLKNWGNELDVDLLSNAQAFTANYRGMLDGFTEFFDDSINTIFTSAFAGLGFLELAREGEKQLETLDRVLKQYQSVTAVFEVIDLTLGDSAVNAVKYSDSLIANFGGLERLVSISESYYNSFFTDEERRLATLSAAQKQLDQLNESIGLTGEAALDTKAEFRSYIEGLDLSTIAGRDALQSALGLQDALLIVSAAADEAANSVLVIADVVEAVVDTSAEDAAKAQKIRSETLRASYKVLNDQADAALLRSREALSFAQTSLSFVSTSFSLVQDAVAKDKEVIENSITNLSSIISSAQSSRASLRASDNFTAQIDKTAASDIVARASQGEVFSAKVLEDALSLVSEPGEGLFSSFVDYQREFFKTSKNIAALESNSKNQLSEEERSLQALTDIEDTAKQQLNALLGINQNVLGLQGALSQFDSSIVSSKAATAASNTAATQASTAQSTATIASTVSERDAFRNFTDNLSSTYKTGPGAGTGQVTTAEGMQLYNYAANNGMTLTDIDAYLGLDGNQGIAFAEYHNLPKFAAGGNHSGGMRLVGENGPELELTGPSRIISNSALMENIGKNEGDKSDSKMNLIMSKLTLLIDRTYRLQQQWTADALNVRVVA